MRLLTSLAILLLVLAAMLADIADGCERPSNSTAVPQEEVESKTTDAATTSAETGTTSTEAPRRRRDAMLHSREADNSSGQAGAVMFSGTRVGDGVRRETRTVMALLTGTVLRAGTGF